MTRTWAVVPTCGRPMLDDLLASLVDQVYDVIVIANNWERDDDPIVLETLGLPIQMVRGSNERNISRWWNLGLDTVAKHAAWLGESDWNVLVVNDDVVCPANLVEALSTAMRATTAAMAYPDQFGGQQLILHTAPEPVPLQQRITGYAWMLRGETGLRADESMAWWYSDDCIDWEARQAGGALLVPGVPVEHRRPNGYTEAVPALAEQATRDRDTFVARWGKAPH